jgi:hypothetical protein
LRLRLTTGGVSRTIRMFSRRWSRSYEQGVTRGDAAQRGAGQLAGNGKRVGELENDLRHRESARDPRRLNRRRAVHVVCEDTLAWRRSSRGAGLEPATRRLTGGVRPLRFTPIGKLGSIVNRDLTRSHRRRGSLPGFCPISERPVLLWRAPLRPPLTPFGWPSSARLTPETTSWRRASWRFSACSSSWPSEQVVVECGLIAEPTSSTLIRKAVDRARPPRATAETPTCICACAHTRRSGLVGKRRDNVGGAGRLRSGPYASACARPARRVASGA